MAKLLTAHIPTTQKELQKLLGKFNYAARFIPHYNKLVAPLKALMGKNSDHKWTAKHTNSLNQLLLTAHHNLKLHIADPAAPF